MTDGTSQTRTDRESLISVVMLSREFEVCLEEHIDSLIPETLRPLEINVARERSTVDSWPIARAYAARFPVAHPDLIAARGAEGSGTFREQL